MIRTRLGYLIASLLLFMTWSRPAAADLVLSLDQSSYTINGVGNTATVEVFVSQNSSGTQVGVGNELLSAAVEMTFASAGVATVASIGDVTFNPAWDAGGPATITTSGLDTLVDLGVVSLAGFSDLSSPLLIGTFVFTGQSAGTTTVSLASQPPGANFVTAPGDIMDPTNVPGAQITVVSNAAVPEPSALLLGSVAVLTMGAGWLRCRATTVSGS